MGVKDRGMKFVTMRRGNSRIQRILRGSKKKCGGKRESSLERCACSVEKGPPSRVEENLEIPNRTFRWGSSAKRFGRKPARGQQGGKTNKRLTKKEEINVDHRKRSREGEGGKARSTIRPYRGRILRKETKK